MNINTFDLFPQVEDFLGEENVEDLLREIFEETVEQEENTMENNTKNYVCPVCHKQYESITDMANCILKDEKEKSMNEKKGKLAALKTEIQNTSSKLEKLVNDYNSLSDEDTYTVSVSNSKKLKFVSSCTKNNCDNSCGKNKQVYNLSDKSVEEWLEKFSKELANGGNIFTKWLDN